MFDFEPIITSLESSPVIQPSIFGPDFDESRINLTIKYSKLPTQSSPDLGKVLTNFDSEPKRHLEIAMIVSHSTVNPAASDSTWETYISWMNSEISKIKDLGYTLDESKFRYGFVPLKELWKLRNPQLCLPAPEVNEASPEPMEEEEEALVIKLAQNIESAALEPYVPVPEDSVMEEAPNQIVIS